MAFDPLFDKLPPKGQRGVPAHAAVMDEVAFRHQAVAAAGDTAPLSPFTKKPMVAATCSGVPCWLDPDNRAVYPVAN